MTKILFLLALSSAGFYAWAANITTGDWLQPQVILIQLGANGKLGFTFCPKSNSTDCRVLGNRKGGYAPAEVAILARQTQNFFTAWWGQEPLAQVLLFASANAGTSAIIASQGLWSVRDKLTQDLNLTSAEAAIHLQLDMPQFAQSLDSELNTADNFQSTCECKSTAPLFATRLFPPVVGKGQADWQAHANAQYNCAQEIRNSTNQAPSFQTPPQIFNCLDEGL